MIFFNIQDQKPTSKKHKKKRLTQDQVRLLERSFTSNKKLEPELKLQLSNQLGIPPRQVAIWYQNKRARWKNQSLELDYNALQVRLEHALTDKNRLEADVERLKDELEKTRRMLIDHNLNKSGGHQIGGNSTEEGGMSSSHGDVKLTVENGEVLNLEDELYACLMAVNGSIWN